MSSEALIEPTAPNSQKTRIQFYLALLKETHEKWTADRAGTMGAAIAFYTVFSLAPLLLVAIAVAGLVFGREAAEGRMIHRISGVVGEKSAQAVEQLVQNARRPASGIIATIAGTFMLLLGGTRVFVELQKALEIIWKAKDSRQGAITRIRKRFVSFAMVFGIGFLLLASMLLSAVLSGVSTYLGAGPAASLYTLQLLTTIVSFGVSIVLFALMFKILPEVHVHWNEVWHSALITALSFTIGKYWIGYYLGATVIGSAFGAAGSVVVVLLWVYYSSLVFMFGAEFTSIFSRSKSQPVNQKEKTI